MLIFNYLFPILVNFLKAILLTFNHHLVYLKKFSSFQHLITKLEGLGALILYFRSSLYNVMIFLMETHREAIQIELIIFM